MKKCEYCAKEITYFEQYCSDDCHLKANKFYELNEKLGRFFSVINMICVFGIPVGIFLFSFSRTAGAAISTLSCLILGLMILILPFPTENMISKYKLKNAIKRTRIFGAIVIAFGIALAAFMLLFF
ncbi:MAG: hypothetical protein LUF33_00610 [Clostridiales bacterium]|nr:hypothetical protein [Clostridiales bacterium]